RRFRTCWVWVGKRGHGSSAYWLGCSLAFSRLRDWHAAYIQRSSGMASSAQGETCCSGSCIVLRPTRFTNETDSRQNSAQERYSIHQRPSQSERNFQETFQIDGTSLESKGCYRCSSQSNSHHRLSLNVDQRPEMESYSCSIPQREYCDSSGLRSNSLNLINKNKKRRLGRISLTLSVASSKQVTIDSNQGDNQCDFLSTQNRSVDMIFDEN